MPTFEHRALDLQDKRPIVYTAMSKRLFYMRMFISSFVLKQGCVPLNPFMVFDYFLLDTIDRDTIRNANNNLVALADELWVFGTVSNGVMAEIKQHRAKGKLVKYFTIEKDRDIIETTKEQVQFEDGMEEFRGEL